MMILSSVHPEGQDADSGQCASAGELGMQRVFSEEVTALSGAPRLIEICVGDATEVSPAERVDLLALSCFHGGYFPTPRTLVKALFQRKIYVHELVRNPARDYRDKWHTWISEPLGVDANFGRLVCFEHQPIERDTAVDPVAIVGNVFRAITEFVQETSTGALDTCRIPLLSTGNQGANKLAMLTALLQSAYTHLRGSLPVRRIQIVLHHEEPELHRLLLEVGRALEQARQEWATSQLIQPPVYDFFLSYRRVDKEATSELVSALISRRPGLQVFLDERNLQRGVCWKPDVICAIHNSRRALCLITDTYADSRECVDEFHIALCLSRARPDFLRPLLRLTNRSIDSLPYTIRRVNLIDANCPPRRMDDVLDAVLAGDA
jgi:hypothetical protein